MMTNDHEAVMAGFDRLDADGKYRALAHTPLAEVVPAVFVPFLVRIACSTAEDDEVRKAAIDLLGLQPPEAATDGVVESLQGISADADEESHLRVAAIAALGHLALDAHTVAHFVGLIADDPDLEVREAAFAGIWRNKAHAAASAALEKLVDDHHFGAFARRELAS